MTVPPAGQQPPPEQPQQWPGYGQPGAQPPQQWPAYGQQPPPGGRRKALPWIIGGAVVVVAALVVTLVLVLGGDDEKSGGADAGTADLSTPVKAAESFAAAVRAGDPAAVLALTCFGSDACVDKYGEGATATEIGEVKAKIQQGIGELADQLADVTFEEPNEASSYLDGAMEVPYRTPRMGSDEFRAMIFVEIDGKWLYIGGSGGSGGSSGGPGGGGPDAETTEAGSSGDGSPSAETETEPTTCVQTSDAKNPFPHCQ